MKFLPVILALMLSCTGYSQSAGKEGAANCIAYWKPGEERTYSIVHEKTIVTPEKKISLIRFGYLARVSVIDATEKDYTIKWVFQLPDTARIKHPEMADSLPVYNGLQMIFRTSEMGTFIELLNWEEVRDAYVNMGAAKDMYNSKAIVEATLIKEIQLFHMPYGYKFTTEESIADTKLPNLSDGRPLPAHQIYRLTELDRQRDQFALAFELKLDRSNIKYDVKDYNIQDYTEYHFIHSTGWITNLVYKRTVTSAGTTQSDAYVIEMQ